MKQFSKILDRPVAMTFEHLIGAYLETDSNGHFIAANRPIPVEVAYVIEAVDSNEALTHIEWRPDGMLPRLWQIHDWKTSITRQGRVKKRSSLERNVYHSVEEVYNKILNCLGLEIKEVKSKTVSKIKEAINKRNYDLLRAFGVDEELLIELNQVFDALDKFNDEQKPS